MKRSNSRGVYAVFDIGGTNIRGGVYNPRTDEVTFLVNVEVPSGVTEQRPDGKYVDAPQRQFHAKLEEAFVITAKEALERGDKVLGVSVSSRGPFENINGQLWWLARSSPAFEFSPGLIEKTKRRAKKVNPTLAGRALDAAALTQPVFPYEAALTRLANTCFGLSMDVPVVQDAAANLQAETSRAEFNGTLPTGARPALLIIGTGVGLAVADDKGHPILDRNGHGPAISRLTVDAEKNLTLTGAINGIAIDKQFGKVLAHDHEKIAKITAYALPYLVPILAEQLADHGSNLLFTTGGVADALGDHFNRELQRSLADRRLQVEVRAGELQQEVGLHGAGAYATNIELRGTVVRKDAAKHVLEAYHRAMEGRAAPAGPELA